MERREKKKEGKVAVKEGSGDTKRLKHCCGPAEKSSKETERRVYYISPLLCSFSAWCERTQDVTLPLYAVVTALPLFHKSSQTGLFRLLHIPVCESVFELVVPQHLG